MYGLGILKGLSVTFKHFIDSYVDDLRYGLRKFSGKGNFEVRQGLKATGVYTVQYPDEKIAVPERFRFVPFLVVDDPDHPERPGHDWCTSCGICAKVCPPQCIWIVRGEDPVSKRPVPEHSGPWGREAYPGSPGTPDPGAGPDPSTGCWRHSPHPWNLPGRRSDRLLDPGPPRHSSRRRGAHPPFD